MPRFTVLIPTHDHGALLSVAVDSVLAQTQADLEIFIVGDGVDADTRAVAVNLACEAPQVRFFDYPKELKRCAANRHAALASANSAFVAYLDDDDFWFPDHLATLDALLADADFVHTRLMTVRPNFDLWAWDDDLARPGSRERMCSEAYNFFSPTCCGHRLDTYRALPQGWSPPVDDTWNDLNMWRKFLVRPDVRARSSRRITSLRLPTAAREDWSLDWRMGELRFWRAAMRSPQVRGRLDALFDETCEHARMMRPEGIVVVRGERVLEFPEVDG